MRSKKRPRKKKEVICSTCGEKDHYMCATPTQSLEISIKTVSEHITGLHREQADIGLRIYEIRGELTAYKKIVNEFEELAKILQRYKIK